MQTSPYITYCIYMTVTELHLTGSFIFILIKISFSSFVLCTAVLHARLWYSLLHGWFKVKYFSVDNCMCSISFWYLVLTSSFFHGKGEFVEQGGKEGDVLMITLSPCGWGARWVNQVKPSVKCMRVELIHYWWPVALHDHPYTHKNTHALPNHKHTYIHK